MSDPVIPIVKGKRWKGIVQGKRAMNGERYAVTFTGQVEILDSGISIYDVVSILVADMEEKNRDMELPDSIQITIE